jgi:hypothetical protein
MNSLPLALIDLNPVLSNYFVILSKGLVAVNALIDRYWFSF